MTKYQDLVPGKFYWVNGVPGCFDFTVAGRKYAALASDHPWHPPIKAFDPNQEYRECTEEELKEYEEE